MKMFKLPEFLKIIDSRITEGSEYLWSCFGNHARQIDCWLQDRNVNVTCIFDTITHQVYQMEAWDSDHQFRWIHSGYQDSVREEYKKRGLDMKTSFDNHCYIDLEVIEDFSQKARAMLQNKPYDTRVQVPIDLDHNELHQLMLRAHEEDITLNQLVEKILQSVIDNYNKQEAELNE